MMKRMSKLMLAVLSICLPIALQAQSKDSRYLAGAVPEVDGKVVFTKEFKIPGMAQDEIYERLLRWMGIRLETNQNDSRVVYSDKENGQVVGVGDDWIVFASTALSLDRTRILYQPVITCQPEECTIEISKVRFVYREGEEKYTAEEWITDKHALNKPKTQLVRGLAKWRRKTVDFMDDFFKGAAEALSVASVDEISKMKSGPDEAEEATNTFANSGPTVIVSQKGIVADNAAVQPPAALQPAQPQEYETVSPDQLSTDLVQTDAGKLVVVIGEDPFNRVMVTVNLGGSLGKVNGKPVVFCILSPDQPYEQIEKAETYTARFYPNGQNEPSLILECEKMASPEAMEGMPRTYVGEIVKASVRK